MQEGDIYETMRALVKRLDQEGLEYAVIGAMALNAHGYRRFTEHVDILLRPETLARFREKLTGLGDLPAFTGAEKTFRDTRTGVKIEVMTTGEYPGDGKPKPVVFPDPVEARVDKENLWVIALEKLVELKLASGLTAPHRLKDLADVQELIRHLRLPLELSNDLDESVRAEYERLWKTAQQAPEESGCESISDAGSEKAFEVIGVVAEEDDIVPASERAGVQLGCFEAFGETRRNWSLASTGLASHPPWGSSFWPGASYSSFSPSSF